MERFDIAVAGNGLAGRIAAIALARLGYSVAIIGPAGESQDGRTTALMDQSIAFLEGLGVWGALSGHAAGLKTMQIIDGTGRLFRAPTVPFRASEIGLEAFGYNFPNSAALNVLGKIIADNDRIESIEGRIAGADVRDDCVVISLEDGRTIVAGFVAAADGRKSLLREAAGITVRRWSYPQTAVVLNFATRSRMAMSRPNSIRRRAPSRRFPCPDSTPALSGCRHRRKPRRFWHCLMRRSAAASKRACSRCSAR